MPSPAAATPTTTDARGDDRRERRRAAFVEAADRVIREQGPGISMADVARAAGVTKPVLYRHFEDKGDLYAAIAKHYVAELMDTLAPAFEDAKGPRARIRVTVDAYFRRLERDPQMYAFLLHRAATERPEAATALTDFIHQLGRRIAVVLETELARFGLDTSAVEPIAHGMMGMAQASAEWWMAQDDPALTREQMVDAIVTVIWQGVSGLPVSDGAPTG